MLTAQNLGYVKRLIYSTIRAAFMYRRMRERLATSMSSEPNPITSHDLSNTHTRYAFLISATQRRLDEVTKPTACLAKQAFVAGRLILSTREDPNKLVAMSDSVLNNPDFQYPCSYGRLYCIALSCAPLAQGVIRDDIPAERRLVPALARNTLFVFPPSQHVFCFLLSSMQKRKAISAGWSTANHDGGLSNC